LTATNNANGCIAQDQAIVSSDGSLPVVNASASGELNCSNQSVLLQSGNNSPNATYSWSGPGFISNLPMPQISVPGTYSVTVTIGICAATDAVEVTQAPALVVTPSVQVLACDVVAEVCLDIDGGTPPYNVQWSNGNTLPCAQIGASGTISVTVTDNGGCSVSSTQAIVIPPLMSISFSGLLNCTGFENVCATVTGGAPPYTYQWSNNTTAGCTSYPGGGLISLTVTDASGCTQTASATVNQTPSIALSFSTTDASSSTTQDGAVNLTVSGGNGQFSYLWNNGATTQDLNNLGAGTYSVTVVDVLSGCTSTGTAVVNAMVNTLEAQWLSQFQLSPNPTEGITQLSLRLRQSENNVRIEVHAITGQLIWTSASLQGDQFNQAIDLSESPAGLYTVSVRLADQVFVRKLSIVR
jgi:hypothetical protein